MNTRPTSAKKQQGAVLVVSLLILGVMTLIGVTAMSQSGLETLMAGNLQLQTNSMSQAENELANAEAALDNIASNPVAYVSYDKGISPIDTLLNRAKNNADSNGEFSGSYIEYLGPRTLPGESIVIGRETPRAGSEIYLFRNTAIHTNLGSGSRRIVQSTYASNVTPVAAASGDGSDDAPDDSGDGENTSDGNDEV